MRKSFSKDLAHVGSNLKMGSHRNSNSNSLELKSLQNYMQLNKCGNVILPDEIKISKPKKVNLVDRLTLRYAGEEIQKEK